MCLPLSEKTSRLTRARRGVTGGSGVRQVARRAGAGPCPSLPLHKGKRSCGPGRAGPPGGPGRIVRSDGRGGGQARGRGRVLPSSKDRVEPTGASLVRFLEAMVRFLRRLPSRLVPSSRPRPWPPDVHVCGAILHF